MNPQFSIVIPTRHRPEFVREALRCAALQRGDFEVVVVDNWVDPALSVRKIFDEANLPQAIYARPPKPLDMVNNWNFALQHARGEYVLFFTDKNFLLPHTLERLSAVVSKYPAEIYNWTGDSFTPLSYSQPFGAGLYGRSRPTREQAPSKLEARPILDAKASGRTPREHMAPLEYALGKICFGAFRRSLIDRILARYGKLFFPISPDYTSMILGLHEADHVVDVGWAGIVQVNTLISNGFLCATDDNAAEAFLKSVGSYAALQQGGLAPGLFTSVAANVAYDYVHMKDIFGLDLKIDYKSWLIQAAREIYAMDRKWSSTVTRDEQRAILRSAMRKIGMLESDAEIVGDSKGRSMRAMALAKIQRSPRFVQMLAPVLHVASSAGLLRHLKSRFHRNLFSAIQVEGAL